MESLQGESLARLRHDLRTPVNHILGYSELLIEDVEERHLEAYLAGFQQIHVGGRQLLETIQSALGQNRGPVQEAALDSFKQNLHGTAAEVLETSTSLLENLKEADKQTLADLHAISRAVQRLMDFSGEGVRTIALRPS